MLIVDSEQNPSLIRRCFSPESWYVGYLAATSQVEKLCAHVPSAADVGAVAQEALRRLPATLSVSAALVLSEGVTALFFDGSYGWWCGVTAITLVALNMACTEFTERYPFAGQRIGVGIFYAAATVAAASLCQVSAEALGCSLEEPAGLVCQFLSCVLSYPKVLGVTAAFFNRPRALNHREAFVYAANRALQRRAQIGSDKWVVKKEELESSSGIWMQGLPRHLVYLLLIEPESFTTDVQSILEKMENAEEMRSKIERITRTDRGLEWQACLIERIWNSEVQIPETMDKSDAEDLKTVLSAIGEAALPLLSTHTQELGQATKVLYYQHFQEGLCARAISILNAPPKG